MQNEVGSTLILLGLVSVILVVCFFIHVCLGMTKILFAPL